MWKLAFAVAALCFSGVMRVFAVGRVDQGLSVSAFSNQANCLQLLSMLRGGVNGMRDILITSI